MEKHEDSSLKLALIAGTGMFLSTLDTGIINVAIPSLMKIFHSPLSTVIWTVTLYTLVLSSSILLFGRLADRVGRLKMYAAGLVLFAISSFLCGAATNINFLIASRAIQGISAAMMQATSIALITTRLRGNNLAKGMGIFGMLLGLGPMMGPTIGGLLLSTVGWRWIFWINIPICLLGLYGCTQLAFVKEELHQNPIHYVNLILLAGALFSLLLMMTFISDASEEYLITLIAAAILLTTYFVLECKVKHPIIDLSLFKRLKFSAPILGIIAFGGATAIAFMLPPLYLEKIRGFQAWQVGLISLSAPLGIVISARLSVRLIQFIGTVKLMVIGMFIMLASLLCLAEMQASWPISWIFLLLFSYGVGGGLFQTPCYLNITSQFPTNRHAFISALIRMLQNLSVTFESAGAAMLISFYSKDIGTHLMAGIQDAWWLAASVVMIAMLALLISSRSSRQQEYSKKN